MPKMRERLFSVTAYFDADEYKQLRAIAKRAGLSLSDVVRMCTMYVINEVLIVQPFVYVVSKAQRKERDER